MRLDQKIEERRLRYKAMAGVFEFFGVIGSALLIIALIALLVTMGAWLALDVLCVMALVREPRLRLPSCILLFATAGAGCYPVTEELLLPVAASWALCGAALCMLAGIIPMGREKEADRA